MHFTIVKSAHAHCSIIECVNMHFMPRTVEHMSTRVHCIDESVNACTIESNMCIYAHYSIIHYIDTCTV